MFCFETLARRASLIASTAQVVAAADPSATTAGTAAQTQLDALGGVWQPWATAVPTSYPTASPVASAAADATAADLVVALADGADQARTACGEETGDAAARLYASLAVAWSLEALGRVNRIPVQVVHLKAREGDRLIVPFVSISKTNLSRSVQ